LSQQSKQIKSKKNESYYDLLDTIKDKKEEIKKLQYSKKLYLLQNSKYIFHYYEEKQKINLGENVKDKTTIHNFFKIKGNTEESSNINSERYNNSKRMYHEFWKNLGIHETVHLHEYVLDSENCLLCNVENEYVCFYCEHNFMKQNYPNYFYNDDCNWELKKELA
jgi:hypothetical protein